ncbi:UDP-N-acetylmuramoyl-tripeptide--D-alanyl-D-alanine ligase [Hippea jasoniae]|uniref:UDP-N-acetylmuramoyl-tripeptide--D-alanyl-D- alanine ligase n=1 Tax=Hippea jasoniae TaxID=944479 RepID=UPI000556F60D|nr:UDP-N-acetylmuramoyl-tripeptide--D-alanyl-D-alanine ligase [Hippea jasoniae]
MGISLEELLEAVSPKKINIEKDIDFEGFSIDSRSIKKKEVFIALKGKRFNGNEFAEDAFERGAAFCITDRAVNCPHIVVDDTLEALKKLAALNLKKSKAKAIAVVGSVGKTTTKELLYRFLDCKFKTCRTTANENNVIGVSKTLLSIKNEEFCVVEVGINHKGEMEEIAEFFKPYGVLFLNVSYTHTEFFDSIEEIFEEKSKIVNSNTKLLFNGDDDLLRSSFEDVLDKACFGKHSGCDFVYSITDERLRLSGFDFSIKPQVHPVCLAAALSGFLYFGSGNEKECVEDRYYDFNPPGLRMNFKDIDGVKFIVDCYNANIDSMMYAIEVLDRFDGKKLAVLGDMLELGSLSKELHRKIGLFLNDTDVDVVFFGKEMRQAKEIFKGRSVIFSSKDALISHIREIYKHYDYILLKGSRGMRLEDVYFALKGEK